MNFKVSRKSHLIGGIISVALVIMLYPLISNITLIVMLDGSNTISKVLLMFFSIIPISFVHELIHAAAFNMFGGVVRMGYKGLYAYTQELSGVPLTRAQFAIVLLSPVTLVSILAMFFPGWIGGTIFVLSLVGSTGDLYMAVNLVKYGPCRIVNRTKGFEITKSI